jgi:lysophospholipase L1-like esterase
MIARSTIAGDAIRVRVDNTFGREPLNIGRAYVGLRTRGALLAAGSNRPVTFGGHEQAAIPAGGSIMSDPVRFHVLAQQDLAVSLFIPATAVKPTQHGAAVVTSYRTTDGSGDLTASEEAAAFTQTTTSLWWLKSIEVEAQPGDGAVVAFGDSITDGTCSTLDAHDRWEDVVATRLTFESRPAAGTGATSRQLAIVNEGIGGNTLTRERLDPPPDSPPALERLDRDVLSHHGVTSVILFMGTNDIRRGSDAAQVTDAMSTIARRVKARGVRVLAVTIIPRHTQPAASTTPWDPARTRIRNEVNAWIRSSRLFDGVLDLSRVVSDPSNPDLLLPAFNCGDGIHPSPRGYFEMGTSVDLTLLRQPTNR